MSSIRCLMLPSAIFGLLSGIDSDIIDEAIYYFKANVFFKNYEIKVRRAVFSLPRARRPSLLRLSASCCLLPSPVPSCSDVAAWAVCFRTRPTGRSSTSRSTFPNV